MNGNGGKRMKLTIAEPGLLKDCIAIISELVNEGQFEVNKEGIELIAMDPANVGMVIFKLLSSCFVEYKVDSVPVKLAINLNNLKQILKRAKPNDMLTLETEEENLLRITLKGATTRTFSLPIIDIEESEQKAPALKFPVTIKTDSSRITEAIEDADIVADSVLLEADQESFVISAKGDLSKVNIVFKPDKSTQILLEENKKYRAKYSIEYLKKMIAGGKLADQVTLQFDNDYPLRLEYKAVDKLMLSFILAPRVENE
ncbi:proliferating cell nuclear antigen (pcna) [Candidatus Woesearchaeota archaeon]|nr:proliferating cell nuclear antigen (pcna) [Candidatus Woesearchaeota archaeon]RLE43627.1 MAG: proliferating cell nuclear antigen (pcna) [Candidatus Woesearchaeota archaeon]